MFPFFKYLEVLRQSSAACKALKVLKRSVLKRLAAAEARKEVWAHREKTRSCGTAVVAKLPIILSAAFLTMLRSSAFLRRAPCLFLAQSGKAPWRSWRNGIPGRPWFPRQQRLRGDHVLSVKDRLAHPLADQDPSKGVPHPFCRERERVEDHSLMGAGPAFPLIPLGCPVLVPAFLAGTGTGL